MFSFRWSFSSVTLRITSPMLHSWLQPQVSLPLKPSIAKFNGFAGLPGDRTPILPANWLFLPLIRFQIFRACQHITPHHVKEWLSSTAATVKPFSVSVIMVLVALAHEEPWTKQRANRIVKMTERDVHCSMHLANSIPSEELALGKTPSHLAWAPGCMRRML